MRPSPALLSAKAFAGSVAVLLLLVAFSGLRLHRAWSEAHLAGENLRDCNQLAGKIAQLREGMGIATSPVSQTELASRVESAISASGATSDVVQNIDPQSPLPTGHANYVVQSVVIEIQDSELSDVVKIAQHLDAMGLSTTSIELEDPVNEDLNRWDVLLTVSQLAYRASR